MSVRLQEDEKYVASDDRVFAIGLRGVKMADQTNPVAVTTNHAYSRRRVIAGSAIGLGGLAIAGVQAAAQEPAADSPKKKPIVAAKAIHQEEDFKAGAQRIYEALLDAKQFSAFSGLAAEIHREVGGAFSLFAGQIVGRNLDLAPNRRIVQAWRAASWPEGIYSIARFEFLRQGSGARVTLDHTGFPPDKAESLESGWNEHYWTALQKYLG
jgi:activator of HSP90 ATPase